MQGPWSVLYFHKALFHSHWHTQRVSRMMPICRRRASWGLLYVIGDASNYFSSRPMSRFMECVKGHASQMRNKSPWRTTNSRIELPRVTACVRSLRAAFGPKFTWALALGQATHSINLDWREPRGTLQHKERVNSELLGFASECARQVWSGGALARGLASRDRLHSGPPRKVMHTVKYIL